MSTLVSWRRSLPVNRAGHNTSVRARYQSRIASWCHLLATIWSKRSRTNSFRLQTRWWTSRKVSKANNSVATTMRANQIKSRARVGISSLSMTRPLPSMPTIKRSKCRKPSKRSSQVWSRAPYASSYRTLSSSQLSLEMTSCSRACSSNVGISWTRTRLVHGRSST